MSTQSDSRAGAFDHFWASGVLLVIVIATGALFLIRAIGPDSTDLQTGGPIAEPDVHMERVALRRFDSAGRLDYELLSPDIRLFRDQGRAELSAPQLTLYQREGTDWQVRAALGTLYGSSVGGEGEDVVIMQDDVLLQALEGLRHGRLTTEAMTLYPQRQYATTDQAVMIEGEGGRTAAAGLEGDLQGGSLKLFSAAERPVQTILLPGQFK